MSLIAKKPHSNQPTGTWSAFKGNALRLWSELTSDDLNVREGDYEAVIHRIHSISGEGLDDIRAKLFRSSAMQS